MARDKLTDTTTRTKVRKAEAGMHGDGAGLYLRVGANGSASWVYRYWMGDRLTGKSHDMGLGPYPLISLADARLRRDEQARKRLDGIDPVAERKAARLSAPPGGGKSHPPVTSARSGSA